MLKKLICLMFLCLSPFGFSLDIPSPGAPVQVNSSDDTANSCYLAGNSSGYCVIWTKSSGEIFTSFSSDNGATWGSPVSVHPTSIGGATIAANNDYFIVTWLDASPGVAGGNIYASYSTDSGSTWSAPIGVETSGGAYIPQIGSSSEGFMIVWFDTAGNGSYSFSQDGLTWESPALFNASGDVSVSPRVRGKGSIFVAGYTNGNGDAVVQTYSRVSNSWSSQIILGISYFGNPLSIGSNSNGFLASWQDNNGNAYSSGSTGGISWSSPSLISSNVQTPTNYTSVDCVGTGPFFLSTIHNSLNEGELFYSENQGSSWSNGILFTQTHWLNDTIYNSFAALAKNTQGVLIAWVSTDSNVYTSFLPLVPSSLEPPSSLSGESKTNKFPFQIQYYNELRWGKSPSEGVDGYKIYRNGLLVAQTPSLSWKDFSVEKTKRYTYSVVAYTLQGEESTPVTVNVKVP